MAAPKKVDYERLEPAWRAGIKSPTQLAAEYTEATGISVSRAAIIKHFTKLGVPRSLADRVKAKADAMVLQAMVTGKVSTETTKRDAEIIGDNATIVANVQLSHRTDISRAKRIANRLLDALERLEIAEVPSDALVEAKAAASTSGKPFEPPASASLKEHTVMFRTLAESQRVLIGLERDAYGLDRGVEPPVDDDVDPVEGARRLAFVLARAAHTIDQQKEPSR